MLKFFFPIRLLLLLGALPLGIKGCPAEVLRGFLCLPWSEHLRNRPLVVHCVEISNVNLIGLFAEL